MTNLPRTIISRERTQAEFIIAKYARHPGIVARELTEAQAMMAKYARLEERAARFDRALARAFAR